MENLVVVWYLLIEASHKSWTVPAPYPTEEICNEVGSRFKSSWLSTFCIPAPVLIQSNDFRDKLFKEKK